MSAVKTLAKREIVGYDEDILLWSQQQAQLLREGRFSELDIEHLADEIEDVGKSEKRELANRCVVLLAHLIKWLHQPDRRSRSWRLTIEDQRKRTALLIEEVPSLKAVLRGAKWRQDVWLGARIQAREETGLDEKELPRTPPFTLEQALDPDFWPE